MVDVNVNFVLGNDEPLRADFELQPDVTYTADIKLSEATRDHTKLYNRDRADQHPMSAITGLEDALDGLSDDITAENNRAVEAEEVLDNKIDSEVDTRADEITRVEGLISDEETRAEGVEGGLREDLTAEINRATNAEGVLQTNITAEENRAKGAEQQLTSSIDSNHQAISNHVSDKNNPHEVTKAQVGLGNVENLAPANMPMSTATKTYVDNADNGLQGQITTINTTIGGYGNIVTHNVSEFATSAQGALADTALQPNDNISELTNNLSYQTATQVANSIAVETSNRESADNNLQSQIDAIVSSSDVFDIVGTYAELQAYDISTVPVNDIIKVLVDSTHAGAATYYRCVETNNVKSWSYIGSEGAYYTKAEADSNFVPQTRTVNNKALSSDITLTATDVGALPSSTVIPTVNDATVTIQKNGSTVSTFTLNQSSNETVNLTVPTKTSEITNDSGFITSSSLPTVNDGQLDIQVNGTSVATFTANQSGNTTANIVVGSGLPSQTGNAGKVLGTDGTDASWQYSIRYIGNYNSSTQYYPGDVVQYYYDNAYRNYLCIQPALNETPYNEVSSYWKPFDAPSKIRVQNDWGDKPILPFMMNGSSGSTITGVMLTPGTTSTIAKFPTINTSTGLLKAPNGIDGYYTSAQVDALIPTVNNSTITFTQGGVTKGSFTLNQSSGATIALDAGGSGGIQNTATGTDSLTILGNPTQYEQAINIGVQSYAYGNYATALGGYDPEYGECQADDYGTSIGASAQGGVGSTAVGYAAVDTGSGNTLVGRETFIDEYVTNSVAIGREAQVTGEGTNVTNAIQLGSGTNSTANSLQVGSYQLLDTSTGLIPTARVSNLLEAIYPVGSVYIGTQSTCPMSTVMSGTTWTLVSSGKALWTGNGSNGNTTINAGLPNITGNIENSSNAGGFTEGSGTGCFTDTTNYAKMKTHAASNSSYDTVANKLVFNASNSNSIYGKSTTVQPPAYVVNVWRRTA